MATPKASETDATTPDSTTETAPAPAQTSDGASSSPDSSPASGPTEPADDPAATDGTATADAAPADGGTSTAEGSAADQASTGPDETVENPLVDATSAPDGPPRIDAPEAGVLPPEEPIKNPEPEEQATTEPDVVQGNGDTIFRGGIRVLDEGVTERVFYCETCAAEGKAREALGEDELAEHAAGHEAPGVVIL